MPIFNQHTLCNTNIIMTFLSKFIAIFLFKSETKLHFDIENNILIISAQIFMQENILFIGLLKDYHFKVLSLYNNYQPY